MVKKFLLLNMVFFNTLLATDQRIRANIIKTVIINIKDIAVMQELKSALAYPEYFIDPAYRSRLSPLLKETGALNPTVKTIITSSRNVRRCLVRHETKLHNMVTAGATKLRSLKLLCTIQ